MITLIRILGNDVPFRHETGQTLRNLDFTLANEYDFEECQKFWVLNRIFDPVQRQAILDRVGPHLEIPIDWNHYRTLEQHEKAAYLTNVNGARNFCLSAFRDTVVAPLDGNCYFTLEGFLRFQTGIQYDRGYSVIMMSRCREYPEQSTAPNWTEQYRYDGRVAVGNTEPQIAFIDGYDAVYDERYPYGQASKLELLYRIGARGIWDNFYPGVRAAALMKKSRHYGRFCSGGHCFRLPSGVPEAEQNSETRANFRTQGLLTMVKNADKIAENTPV